LLGRTVPIATGFTSAHDKISTSKRVNSCASSSALSINENELPMQTRGPAANGI
jgi:hypothetical protein